MLNLTALNSQLLFKPIIQLNAYNYSNKPGVLLDVDGVLKRGHLPIPQAKQSIELLRKHKIPFLLVTNGGGALESSKACTLAKMLKLNKEHAFNTSEIILCHTPMQSVIEKMSQASSTKIPLIVGCGDMHSLMKSYNVKRYITDKEYGTIFSHILGFNTIEALLPFKAKVKAQVEQRLNMKINTKNLIGINGIFQVTDTLKWEIPIQLCCDLLISKDGIPGTERRSKNELCQVEYHIANPDLDYADVFSLPRFCGGSFFYLLQELFKVKYKFDFPFVPYGKPYRKIYDFARERIKSTYPNDVIGNYYMIGDNPETDIKGANSNGIHSILVKTGMFHSKDNDKVNPGKTVVNTVLDAIKFILDKERI